MNQNVTVIPAKEPTQSSTGSTAGCKRVAAYCRVSTDSLEQINSYNAQKTYYTQYITARPDWKLVGIYADEGISGTSRRNRTAFNRMIDACRKGKIDLIIAKSLSRFARNTVDCLEAIRMLRGLGIGVIFEKEQINTLTETSEFMLTLFSGFAQAESESLSKNVAWGHRKSMEAGNAHIPYSVTLGYRKGADGKIEIDPEQAQIVEQIFRLYLAGSTLEGIKNALERSEIRTPTGKTIWSIGTIRNILGNELYIGDALRQKTYVTDCISKKTKKNNGELPMYYIRDHHPAIISRELFQQVQAERTRRASRRKVMTKTNKTELGKYSGKYALTERMFCGECGSPYRRITWTSHGKKRIVWRCTSRLEHGTRYCHQSPSMPESALHSAIVNALNDFAKENHVDNAVAQIIEDTTVATSSSDNVPSIQNQIAALEQQQRELLELVLADMGNTELTDQLQALMEKKQVLQAQLHTPAEESAHVSPQLEKAKQWMDDHPESIQTYDDQATRQLVERVTVVSKDTVRIKFYGTEDERVSIGAC